MLLWSTLMPSKSLEVTAGKTKCGKQHRRSPFSIWLPEENKEKVYDNGETMQV